MTPDTSIVCDESPAPVDLFDKSCGTEKPGRDNYCHDPPRGIDTMARIFPCIRGDRQAADAGTGTAAAGIEGSGSPGPEPVFSAGTHTIIEEVPVHVNVNGRHVLTAMTSPVDHEEFVTGILFTEGIIRGAGEIESMRIDGSVCSVITTNCTAEVRKKKLILSGCGGDSSFLDVKKLPRITSGIVIPYDAILAGVRKVLDSDLHRVTGGIHTVGLVHPDGSISSAEDIGRHNALDRVIGRALRNNTDISRSFAVLSGRISSEMIRKCLVAGIPAIVSRGATTSLAIDAAESTGLTVIGFVRAGKMVIYTHPERVEGAPVVQ